MIELSALELALLIWAALASALVAHYRAESKHRGRLLVGAAEFAKKMAMDDKVRDQIRALLKADKDAEVHFG